MLQRRRQLVQSEALACDPEAVGKMEIFSIPVSMRFTNRIPISCYTLPFLVYL